MGGLANASGHGLFSEELPSGRPTADRRRMESRLPRVCGSFLRELRVLTPTPPRWLGRHLGAPYLLRTDAELLLKLAGPVTAAVGSEVSQVIDDEPASTPGSGSDVSSCGDSVGGGKRSASREAQRHTRRGSWYHRP